jgi:hypothetical protein
MCHLNAHGITPTNAGGACGLNATLSSFLCGPFFTSLCDVHTRLCVHKHPWPQVLPPRNRHARHGTDSRHAVELKACTTPTCERRVRFSAPFGDHAQKFPCAFSCTSSASDSPVRAIHKLVCATLQNIKYFFQNYLFHTIQRLYVATQAHRKARRSSSHYE